MKEEISDIDREYKQRIRRYWIIGISVFVIIGAVVGFLLWNKAHQESIIKYKGVYDQAKIAFYLVEVPDALIPQTKQAFVKGMSNLSIFINHTVWITSFPDSFTAGDPIDKRVIYHTAPNILSALDLVSGIVAGNNLQSTTSERILLHSFEPDSIIRSYMSKMVKDGIISGTYYSPLK